MFMSNGTKYHIYRRSEHWAFSIFKGKDKEKNQWVTLSIEYYEYIQEGCPRYPILEITWQPVSEFIIKESYMKISGVRKCEQHEPPPLNLIDTWCCLEIFSEPIVEIINKEHYSLYDSIPRIEFSGSESFSIPFHILFHGDELLKLIKSCIDEIKQKK